MLKQLHSLKILLLSLLLAIISGCIYFISISNSYNAFLDYCTVQTGKPFLRTTIEAYLPPTRIALLRIIATIAAVVSIIAGAMVLYSARLDAKYRLLSGALNIFTTSIKNLFSFKVYTPFQKKILVGAIVFLSVHSLYYIWDWDIQHDECWTYNYYINQSWAFSFLAPNNNHYLYTAICWWANHIPFLNAKITMRLVALMASVIAIIFYFKLLSNWLQHTYMQLLGMAIFVSSMPLLYYSIIGRSYSFTILFVCVSMLCFQKIIETASNTKYFFYLALATALGVFSNITYVYPMLGFIIYSTIIAINNKALLRLFLKTWLASIMASFVLLLVPVFLLKGFQPLSAVGLQPVVNVWGNIQLGFKMLSYYFSGHLFASFIWVVLIVITALLLFKSKQKLLLLCLVQFVLSIIIYALQGPHLFERLFTYLVPFVALSMLYVFQYLFQYLKNNLAISGSVAFLFLLVNVYQFKHHFLFNWNIGIDKACTKTAQFLLANNIDSVYSFYVYPKPCIEYYYNKAGLPISIMLNSQGSVSYTTYDSSYRYKAIISATEDSLQFKNYTTISIDNWVNVNY